MNTIFPGGDGAPNLNHANHHPFLPLTSCKHMMFPWVNAGGRTPRAQRAITAERRECKQEEVVTLRRQREKQDEDEEGVSGVFS